MENKTKKILYGIIDAIGYGMGISLSVNTVDILYRIYKHGHTTIWHSTGKPLLLTEIGLTSGTTVFFIYKFIKNMIDREKLYKK